MTTKEQNAAIKRMGSRIKNGALDGHSPEAKELFTTLYYADREMKYIDKESVIILFVLNRRFKYENINAFGPLDY